MLPSCRKFFRLSALCAAPFLCGYSQDSGQVVITPRAKTPVKQESVLPKADIRVNATLVLIPVTVTDPLNRFVTGLEKENFKVSEDKKEQEIVSFTSEDAPLSIGLVF